MQPPAVDNQSWRSTEEHGQARTQLAGHDRQFRNTTGYYQDGVDISDRPPDGKLSPVEVSNLEFGRF